LVTQPQILLFDEPLSNLDAKLREYVRLEIRELQKRLKITSIYVTHDQAKSLVISNRIVVMNQGKIEQIADAFSIYRYPRNRFVVNFIGLANIFGGEILSQTEDGIYLRTAVGDIIIKTEQQTLKKKLTVNWRPEDMVVYKEGIENKFNGEITQSIFMGNLTDLFE